MTRYYTGVGSRKAPKEICDLVTLIARRLHELGWQGYSGEAPGIDRAVSQGDPNCHAFLPWKGFSDKGQYQYDPALWEKAEKICADPRVYSGWKGIESQIRELERTGKRMTRYGKSIRSLKAILKLHTRNVFQVLGPNLDKPTELTLCWTPDGALSRADYKAGVTGGTGTAINLSSLYGVPVANLQRPEHRKIFEDFLTTGQLDLNLIRRSEPTPLELF